MPRGVPSIITNHDRNKDRREELAQSMPTEEVLGTIGIKSADPEGPTTTWTREDGTEISLTEPPPPWEVKDPEGRSMSDARRFVEVPPNWKLYWVNPKALNADGWRDWQAVLASDPRVNVRVSTMVTPEGYIRRGGPNGDILAWMWSGWYESIKLANQRKTAGQAQSAVDRQLALQEEFARGTYDKGGAQIRVDGIKHPKFTNIDNRTIKGDS